MSSITDDAEIPPAEMSAHIEAAIDEANRAGIAGKAVTPFLLETINRLSGGRSLRTNIALVKNNARLAAEIAIARTRPESADQSAE